MPINRIDKKRPICDTDIWIKNCKYKEIYKSELIFDIYDKVYMSDAVRQELGPKRDDEKFKEDFELGLRHFHIENNNRLSIIRSYDDSLFNEEEKAALEREFLEHDIIYDKKELRYKGSKSGLGERVTLVLAAILEIPIILSDDSHCRNGAMNMKPLYPYLKVINLYNLLKIKGFKSTDIGDIKELVNEPIRQDNLALSEVAADDSVDSSSKLISYKDRFKKIV